MISMMMIIIKTIIIIAKLHKTMLTITIKLLLSLHQPKKYSDNDNNDNIKSYYYHCTTCTKMVLTIILQISIIIIQLHNNDTNGTATSSKDNQRVCTAPTAPQFPNHVHARGSNSMRAHKPPVCNGAQWGTSGKCKLLW